MEQRAATPPVWARGASHCARLPATHGVVLACTAATTSKTHRMIAVGAAFFLASDTLLAFRLFTPEGMPPWTCPLVLLTYTLGQGIVAGGGGAVQVRQSVISR